MSDGITEARRGTYFDNSTTRVNKPEQEKPSKTPTRNWFLKYGHWSFFVLSIAEALVGDGLTAIEIGRAHV
jgi:hypothetical protein